MPDGTRDVIERDNRVATLKPVPAVVDPMSDEDGEAEFVCPFCGRGMTGQDTLLDHFATKHDMSGFSEA